MSDSFEEEINSDEEDFSLSRAQLEFLLASLRKSLNNRSLEVETVSHNPEGKELLIILGMLSLWVYSIAR